MTISGGVETDSKQSGSILCSKPLHYPETYLQKKQNKHIASVFSILMESNVQPSNPSPHTPQSVLTLAMNKWQARRVPRYLSMISSSTAMNIDKTIQTPFCLLRAQITARLPYIMKDFFLPFKVFSYLIPNTQLIKG